MYCEKLILKIIRNRKIIYKKIKLAIKKLILLNLLIKIEKKITSNLFDLIYLILNFKPLLLRRSTAFSRISAKKN